MNDKESTKPKFQNISVPGVGRMYKPLQWRKKQGVWYESPNWSVEICYRGKPKSWSSRSPKITEARKLLLAKHAELNRNGLAAMTEDKVTFEQMAEAFLRDYQITGKRSLRSAK